MVTAKERTLQAEGRSKKKPAGVLRITIDGVAVDVNPLTITIREAHRASVALQAGGYPETNQMRAASHAWVVAQRSMPDITLDDVLDSMTLGDLGQVLVETEDDSPEA